jgi:nicotinate-nucleotide adenylyltransferase
MKVGLFGGSFDPVHHGHLIVAQVLAEALALDELRFVPAREQPFKVGRHGAPPESRARMLALAIEQEPRFRLERAELDRPGPSYTIDTLRLLAGREPDHRFTLLVGADAARELPSWREAPQLAGLAELALFARAGEAVPPLPWPHRTVTVPGVDISATAIRRRVAEGRSVRYWVPDAVAEVIRLERLYLSDA